ncbi:MAG TPA: PrsW family glutamic-type intramembrane protease [Spirochaetota bacterium]|nr:PrsW family glutamic-type intramembrane protease [Spirochaetota bacterium]HNV46897.1 PrsW family glutamic-type intramembrane protease [Spirochaetota bacterium]HOS40998.1 PrsW family glutamic-type intramembrane protease [Spirochaetota bacterium]HPU87707.1 PrsW family glutamic-type intramembrane protease [Spirochaetota bacterium]
MEMPLLVVLAVVPPILFLLYILRYDRLEPEPLSLIARALFLGAIAVIPAGTIELLLQPLPLFKSGGLVGAGLTSFILIAPVEEAAKLAVVLAFFWKNQNFNEENDGIVYTGSVAVGFALAENVLYVIESGLAIGILRAITSIPLHTFTGVLMGYFVGMAKFAETPAASKRLILRGFLIAYVVHAAYDTVVLSGTAAALLMVPIVVVLFIAGFRFLKRGQALSAKRWEHGPSPASATPSPDAPSPDMPRETHPGPSVAPQEIGVYRIVISRTLFALTAVFWALMALGIVTSGPEDEIEMLDAIAGGIILTFVPVVAAITLELSHARLRKASAL